MSSSISTLRAIGLNVNTWTETKTADPPVLPYLWVGVLGRVYYQLRIHTDLVPQVDFVKLAKAKRASFTVCVEEITLQAPLDSADLPGTVGMVFGEIVEVNGKFMLDGG